MKKHDVEQIIKAFSKKYGKQAKEIENAIRKAMANGMSIAEAVKEATKETEAWMTSHVMESMLLSVSAGSGVHFEELLPALTNAWDASGMKLSKKIHGTTKEMRSAIISTLCKAQKDGKKVIETARALYDGYGYGHVTRTQPLPDYLDKVLTYARRMDLSDKDKDALMREIRNAKRATERLSQNNAPNRTLKAVYKELVTHIERSEDRMMERSLKAAVEEKSRYIAERIARTESARAWADGFIARYGDDEDVVAYQWKTGSRHPEEDICDMYANANLWNLGKGIFPKDKCPILPIHPHCLCHLAPVFISEVDIDNAQDQRDAATCDWLKRQNENTRENLLGVKGNKAWEEGRKTWRTVLRNYSPKVMKSRIDKVYGAFSSGALNDKNDPWQKRRNAHAKRYYETLRNSNQTHIINMLSRHSDMHPTAIKKVLEHLLYNRYNLSKGYARFDESYEMSVSFQRLLSSNIDKIQKEDIIMLKHEHLEYELMNRYKYDYDTAHALTNRKYNYEDLIRNKG